MRPTRLTLNDFKSHTNTDIDLTQMHVAAITGTNGAGKSTILDAIVYALYGADGLGLSKRADSVIREGAAYARVGLDFTLAGQQYRVLRERRLSGKSTLELQHQDGTAWRPLTKGTMKETQLELEKLIGCNAETFLQAVYIGQGDASRFATATPAERKTTLGQTMGLDQYPELQAGARTRARNVAEQAGRLELQCQDLEQRATAVDIGEAAAAKSQIEVARYAVEGAENQLKMLQQRHSDARVAAAAGEQARQLAADKKAAAARANADRAAAHTAWSAATRQAEQSRLAASRIAELEASRPALVDVAALEEAAAAAGERLQAARDQVQEVNQRHRAIEQANTRCTETAQALTAVATELANAEQRLADMEQQVDPNCPTCAQALGQEARAVATAALTLQIAQIGNRKMLAQEDATAAAQALEQLGTAAAGDGAVNAAERTAVADAATTQDAVNQSRRQNEQHHAAGEAIAQAKAAADRQLELEAAVDAAHTRVTELTELTTAVAKEAAEAEANANQDDAAARIAELQTKVTAAELQLKGRRDALAAQEREAAALQERLAAAETAAQELTRVREQLEPLKAQEGSWSVLERAFGREGIPNRVIRQAVPQIQRDINDTLAAVGAPYQVRIDLERDTKAGTVSETLDITILAGAHERPFDLLSGGEQYRVNVALRVAIARLLAHRAGSRIETLVLDEPEGLDTAGFSALADLLKQLGQEFPLVLTVSHTDGLEAACDTTIRVEKTDQGSRVEVAA